MGATQWLCGVSYLIIVESRNYGEFSGISASPGPPRRLPKVLLYEYCDIAPVCDGILLSSPSRTNVVRHGDVTSNPSALGGAQ